MLIAYKPELREYVLIEYKPELTMRAREHVLLVFLSEIRSSQKGWKTN